MNAKPFDSLFVLFCLYLIYSHFVWVAFFSSFRKNGLATPICSRNYAVSHICHKRPNSSCCQSLRDVPYVSPTDNKSRRCLSLPTTMSFSSRAFDG